jgi:hypothetical protein
VCRGFKGRQAEGALRAMAPGGVGRGRTPVARIEDSRQRAQGQKLRGVYFDRIVRAETGQALPPHLPIFARPLERGPVGGDNQGTTKLLQTSRGGAEERGVPKIDALRGAAPGRQSPSRQRVR